MPAAISQRWPPARETRINRDSHEIGRFQESESTTTAASRTNAVRTLQERSRLLENHAEFGDPQSAAEPAVHEQERRIHNHRLSTAIRKRATEQRTQRRRTCFEPAWPQRGSRFRWPLVVRGCCRIAPVNAFRNSERHRSSTIQSGSFVQAASAAPE